MKKKKAVDLSEDDDPIIAEVRQARRELFAQFDNDIHKVFEHFREMEKTYPGKVVDFSGEARKVIETPAPKARPSKAKKDKPSDRAR